MPRGRTESGCYAGKPLAHKSGRPHPLPGIRRVTECCRSLSRASSEVNLGQSTPIIESGSFDLVDFREPGWRSASGLKPVLRGSWSRRFQGDRPRPRSDLARPLSDGFTPCAVQIAALVAIDVTALAVQPTPVVQQSVMQAKRRQAQRQVSILPRVRRGKADA